LGRREKFLNARRRRDRGFSMTELAVSLAIVLVLSAIAIPSMIYSYRVYKWNDSAARIASLLKFTRFEAVRKNRPVSCQILAVNSTDWRLWADTNNNNTADPGEMQYLVTGELTLLPAGTPPPPTDIQNALGSVVLTPASNSSGSITFDHRGAVSPSLTYVLYIGSPTNPEFGYRAVVLLPTGIIQVWTAPAAGPWQRLS
jgi:prepilin-type N-terminal cleavage/methylation domain-containing protein